MITEKSRKQHEKIRDHILFTVPKTGKGSLVLSIGKVIGEAAKETAKPEARESV